MLYERMRRKVTSSTSLLLSEHNIFTQCWSAVYDTGPALVFHSGCHPAFCTFACWRYFCERIPCSRLVNRGQWRLEK